MEIVYIQHPISDSVTAMMEECVLAVGFFDGIHIGHQRLLHTAKEIAKKKQLTFGVLTFYPHPREVVNPNQATMKYLTPFPMKEERFEYLGVEKLFVVKFEPEFSHLYPEDFVNQYILGLCCKHVVAGFDYCYGYKGQGNMKTLTEQGDGMFEVTTIPKIEHHHEKISSSAIRQLLAVGNVGSVFPYLGDFYEIRGEVERASLFYNDDQFLEISVDEGYLTPAPGVYHIEVKIGDHVFGGVCHQFLRRKNKTTLLVKISEYSVNFSRKHVKVKWVQSICRQQKETYDMSHYLIRGELVI